MAGERGNEEAKKKREWNDGDAPLHSMSASRILPLERRTNHANRHWLAPSGGDDHLPAEHH